MVYVAAFLAEAPTSDSTFDNLALLTRRERLQMALLAVVLIGLAVFVSFKLVQSVPPRQIVLASGAGVRRLPPSTRSDTSSCWRARA